MFVVGLRMLLAPWLAGAGVAVGVVGTVEPVLPAIAAAPLPGEIAPALLAKIHLQGPFVAHLSAGTQVTVSGYVTNTDGKRHDAYVVASLLDGKGQSVGRAAGKAEDLVPGKRYRFSIVGSALAPHWAKVTVKVTRVTENVPGEQHD